MMVQPCLYLVALEIASAKWLNFGFHGTEDVSFGTVDASFGTEDAGQRKEPRI